MISRSAADHLNRARGPMGTRSGRLLVLLVALGCATLALACSSEDSGLDDDEATTTTETSPGSGSTDPNQSRDDERDDSDASTTTLDDPSASWRLNATSYRGENGRRVTVECSPDGQVGSLWGSGPYTDDSSICTAGVHAGVIALEEGGDVEIEIAPGEDSYEGSERNGVTSMPYPRWDGSFLVVDGS